jgi:predicted TIM-barrel fold metal-dependent hydrolase
MARRVFETVGWHLELYADAKDLGDLFSTLVALPAVSIDHLGLSAEGLPLLIELAERGVKVKASGFGRVNFDVGTALKALYSANPAALMFGTDLPSTRAARPYSERDFQLVIDTLGEVAAERVFYANAVDFYRTGKKPD